MISVQEHWQTTLENNRIILSKFIDSIDSLDQIKGIPGEILVKIRETRNILLELFAQAFFSSEQISQELFALAVEVNNFFVKSLTRIEDLMYRNGEKKSIERILLFILTMMAGETIVPSAKNHENQDMRVLDYRKRGKAEEDQKGELLEAVTEYYKYLQEPTEATALGLLIELADVVYNTSQALGIDGILQAVDTFEAMSDEEKVELKKLVLVLMQVANIKFVQRYILKGNKDEEVEKLKVHQKLERNGIDVHQLVEAHQKAIVISFSFFYDLNKEKLEAEVQPILSEEELKEFMQTLAYAVPQFKIA